MADNSKLTDEERAQIKEQFEQGQHVVGSPHYVIVNGRVCFDDGQLRVVEGDEKFPKSPEDSPLALDDLAHDHEQAPHRPEFLETAAAGNMDNTFQESLSPTMRRKREPGTRNLQTSTFSIRSDGKFPESTEDSPLALDDVAHNHDQAPHSPEFFDTHAAHVSLETAAAGNMDNTFQESLSPTMKRKREPGTRNLQTSTFSIRSDGKFPESTEDSPLASDDDEEIGDPDTKTSDRKRNSPGDKSSDQW